MKQFEKDLKKIIDSIDQSGYPFAIELLDQYSISRESYSFLINRGLIERIPSDTHSNYTNIRITTKGYAYFMEKSYARRSFWTNILISVFVGGTSGFITSIILSFLGK